MRWIKAGFTGHQSQQDIDAGLQGKLLAKLLAVIRARCAKKGILEEQIHETLMMAGNQLYLEIIVVVMKFCFVTFVGRDLLLKGNSQTSGNNVKQ